MKKLVFLTMLLAGFITTAFAGASDVDFDKAMEAYEKGDDTTAFKLFEKSCNAGDTRGCTALGFMYEEGKGVKQDDFKAVELYTKACNAVAATGCAKLGVMYENAVGVKQDYKKAKEFFVKACKLGFHPACRALIAMYEKGER